MAKSEAPPPIASLNRRRFLRRLTLLGAALGGGGLALIDPLSQLSRSALGIGRATQVDIAYLELDGAEPNPRPGVIELMLFELARNTSVEVQVESVAIRADDPKIFDHPLLFLFGTRALPSLSANELSKLELYLRSGGILFVDDSSGLDSSPFDRDVRQLAGRLFPHRPLDRIPQNHVLFRTFFLLPGVAGRSRVRPYLEGVTLGAEMTPIIYSQNDLAGAFARDPMGGYLYECVPGGERQRTVAYKLGINILMYALCLNYKHDLTHVRALLQRPRGVFDE